jgi:hypothetical protein
MILLTDQPKKYRVYRAEVDAEGHQSRKQLGAIPKASMEVPSEITSVLTSEEQTQLAAQLNFFNGVERSKLLGTLAALPENIREAVDYAFLSGTDAHRRILSAAIFEAVRVIRKYERAGAD